MDQQFQPQGQSLSAQELAIMKKNRRLSRLRQKKLDRKQKLLEKKKTLLRDYLAREMKYGKHTLRKHQAEWKRLLISIAIPRQIEEVELAQQNFEQVMDIKDYIISCLMDKLRQSEDHYMMCLNTHISKVDEIIARFHCQLNELHNNYDLQIKFLTDQETDFITGMEKTTNTNIDYLKSIVYGLEFEHKVGEMNLKADYCAKVELEMDKQELLLFQPRIEFEGMLRCIWDEKHSVFQTYQMKTETRRKNYEVVKAANTKFEELSAKALKKIDYLNIVIRKLKNKENEIKKNKLQDLNLNLKSFQRIYLILKQKLTDDLRIDKHKHELLVWISHNTYTRMSNILKRGKYLVRFLQCCKRLETSDEKVRPYPLISQKNEYEGKAPLFLFWQKMGKVNAIRSAIREEKIILMFENECLSKSIENYCTCLSCPKLPPICRKEGSIPFTDGTTMMKKYDFRNRSRRR